MLKNSNVYDNNIQYWKSQEYKYASRNIKHPSWISKFAYLKIIVVILDSSSNLRFGNIFKQVFLHEKKASQFWKIHTIFNVISTFAYYYLT